MVVFENELASETGDGQVRTDLSGSEAVCEEGTQVNSSQGTLHRHIHNLPTVHTHCVHNTLKL